MKITCSQAGISCYNKDNTKGGTRMKDREDKLGLYVHIPFCRSKCDYCDFYSLAGQDARMADYQKALLAHLKETALSAHSFRWIPSTLAAALPLSSLTKISSGYSGLSKRCMEQNMPKKLPSRPIPTT